MARGRGLVIVGPDVMPSAFYDSPPLQVGDPDAAPTTDALQAANSLLGGSVLVGRATGGDQVWERQRGLMETGGGGEGGVLGKEWRINWPADDWAQLKAAAEAGGWSIAGLASSQRGQVQGVEADDNEVEDYEGDTGSADYTGDGKGAAGGGGGGDQAAQGAGVTLQQQRKRRGRSLAQTRTRRQTNAAAPQFDAATIPVGCDTLRTHAPGGGGEMARQQLWL